MKKTLRAVLATSFFMLGMATAANASPIFLDNFNTENGGTGVLNYTGLANWTVSGGTVDLIGNGFWDLQAGYGLYLDMDGSNENAGMITSTTITLNAGSYLLQFDLAGNQRVGQGDSVIANVNTGFSSGTYLLGAAVPFQTFTQQFTLASQSTITLSFEGTGGDNVGMLLDNVQLNAVPEPTTMLLFSAGIAGLAAVGRRKRS